MLNSFLSSYGLCEALVLDETKCVNAANIKCHSAPNAAHDEKMPLVSILVTTYNTSSYVKASLESLLNQTYKNIEIIAVDDKSTDDTVSKIADISAQDSRLKFFVNRENTGTFAAKTLALKQAKGEFVVCHDSDDFAHSEWIERQIKPLLENKKLVASVSQWIRVSNDGKYWTRNIYPFSRLNRTSLLFKKEIVLEKTGSWDIVRTGADSEFHARLKLVFGKEAVKYIKLPLTIGAYRENSLTTSSLDGYDKNGISPVRLAYWEAWTRWHIECLKKGKRPMMTASKRPFPAPEQIIVQSKDYSEFT
jgi:glycosyltransferase involved in cell wall biosynthesis